MQNRRLRITIVASAIAALVATVSVIVLASRTQSEEPATIVETVATGPAGQPGPTDIQKPNVPDDPGEPTTYGPFRLVPFGYDDPADSTRVPVPSCGNPGITSDLALLQSSVLDAGDIYVPQGFAKDLPVVATTCDGEVAGAKWQFAGDQAALIEVVRRYAPTPIDVRRPQEDGWNELLKTEVEGVPAVGLRVKSGQPGPQALYLYSNGVLTLITANVGDFAEVLKIAQSLP